MNSENHQTDFSALPKRQFDAMNQPSNDCREIEAAVPAHAFGATDQNEAAAIHARLAHCPQAADDFAAYQAVATRMLYSAPPVAAPAQIAERLRSAIAAAPSQSTHATGHIRPGFLPRTKPGRMSATARRSHSLPPTMADYQLENIAENPAFTYSTSKARPLHKTERPQRTASWQWARMLATAAVVALVFINIALLAQNQQLVEQSRLLTAQNQQLFTQQESLTQHLAQQNQALILLAAEEPQEIEIFDPSGQSAAQADILWNNSLGIAVVYVRDFPQCQSGMKYQLWLTKDGQRSSGGLFSVDTSGMGLLVVKLDHSLDAYDVIGITSEPAAGSPGPTSPPIVRGEL